MNEYSSNREPFTDDSPAGRADTGRADTGRADTGRADTGRATGNSHTGDWDARSPRPHRPPLRRAYHGRMLAGVAAGIADYLGVDATIVRIAFAVAVLLGGAGIPAYLACLLLIPEEGSDVSLATELLDSIQSR